MPASHQSRSMMLLAVVTALLVVAGCSDNDPTAPLPGSVIVTVTPDGLAAGWTLTGPNSYMHDGVGNETIEDLVVGDYTLTWNEVATYQTPDPATAALYTGGAITFAGLYSRLPASSADEVIQYFNLGYGGMDLGLYEFQLAQDFLFADQSGGIDNYDDEIAIADLMFHGQPGENNIIISSITIDRLDPQGIWGDTPANDPNFGGFPGSQYRQYLVDFKFAISGQNLILRVQGPVLFYTLNVASPATPDFKILGMVDATYGNKATEDHSWSAVRGLFD